MICSAKTYDWIGLLFGVATDSVGRWNGSLLAPSFVFDRPHNHALAPAALRVACDASSDQTKLEAKSLANTSMKNTSYSSPPVGERANTEEGEPRRGGIGRTTSYLSTQSKAKISSSHMDDLQRPLMWRALRSLIIES